MNDYQKQYYFEMQKKNRLVGLKDNRGNVIGLLTFYIGNGNPEKFIRNNPWSVLSDDENGDCIYVDHLLGTKNINHFKYSFKIWKYLKEYFKRFKNVKYIHWARFKDGKHYIFRKEIQNDTRL